MKKAFKRILVIVGSAVFVVLLVWGTVAARWTWFFSHEIASGLIVSQRSFEGVFDLRSPHSDILVKNVGGWIVSPRFVYGGTNDSKYFAVELHNFETRHFTSLDELNAFLGKNLLPPYDLNSEETVADLRYGAGRNRKYGQVGANAPLRR